jgi:hypothetical protein
MATVSCTAPGSGKFSDNSIGGGPVCDSDDEKSYNHHGIATCGSIVQYTKAIDTDPAVTPSPSTCQVLR